MRVLVFGASITQGLWDSQGGWVQRLRQHYDQIALQNLQSHNEPTLFNLGVSADSTRDVLVRFENETKSRIHRQEPIAIIFSIGTNNAREENGKLFSTPEEYRQDIKELVRQAKKYSHIIMLVGLPACDENLTTPVFWRDINYRNRDIQTLEQIMQEISQQQTLSFIPVFKKFINKPELLADGLHPNDAGHKLIADLVLPELEKLLA